MTTPRAKLAAAAALILLALAACRQSPPSEARSSVQAAKAKPEPAQPQATAPAPPEPVPRAQPPATPEPAQHSRPREPTEELFARKSAAKQARAQPGPGSVASDEPRTVLLAYREGRLKLPPPPPLRHEKEGACTSPGEPGCEVCCTKTTESGCVGLRGSPKPPGNGSPPWYTVGGLQSDKPCPKDCKPCATCTLRDEWDFEQVQLWTECDCTRKYEGVDACFNPMGCACICGHILGAIQNCPQLHPARAR
jgi:hypothetical protein